MAATHVDTQSVYTAGGGASLTRTITVSGTDPVLIVHVSSNSPTNTMQYATAVSWSLGGGEALTKLAERRNAIDGANALSQTWVRAAPTAGAGTVTVTFNIGDSARPCSIVAQAFSGAHQTTPCPVGDVVQVDTATTPLTVTPTNLATGDATTANSADTAGALTTVAPNSRLLDNAAEPGVGVGDATGTTGVTFTGDGTQWRDNHAITAVRIVASAATGFSLPLDGTSYGLTGADTTLQQLSPLTWLRVGR